MNKTIKLEQISENEVEVVLSPETPMEMVNELFKGLKSRGLVEDLNKSTLSIRYFTRPTDKVHTVADELIKSLESMFKGIDPNDRSNPYSKASQIANREKNRINDRRAQSGSAPLTEAQIAESKVSKPPKAPVAPTTPKTPNTTTGPKTLNGPNKLVGEIGFGGYMTTKKSDEDDADDVEKSGYGPKRAGLYNPNDNARRKANNTGDQTGFGSNVNTKQYTTAKFGNKDMQSTPAQKRPGPVKSLKDGTLNPSVVEEIKARAANLKKSAWGQHLPFPSAEEEIMKLAKSKPQSGEDASANQLAALMSGKNMLGEKVHPAVAAMMAPPPPQPTDEQMFGHLVVSEEMAKKADQQWAGTLNNFFAEATKPITQRFASEEEELAYWSNIKVDDRDDGKSGY